VNPYSKAPANRKLLTLIGIYVAALVTRFISTGTFTLLPMMANDIGGVDIYPLASSITGLLSICAMPVFGYLGSRNPLLKRTLLIGSLLVGVVVLITVSLASSMFLVIFANFFYGVVSASIFVVAFGIIRDMYDAKQAGVYLGFIGTMTSIGMLVGPALAGLVTDFLGWRFAYHLSWVLLAVSVVLIFAGVKLKKSDISQEAKTSSSFDLPGMLLLTLFLAGLILGLSFGRSYIPFGSPANIALFVMSLVSLVGLILVIAKKRERAFIPATVFKDRNTVVLAANNLFINFSTIALTFFMPSYVINVLHGTAFQAGLCTAIYAILGVFICPFLGRMIAKSGNARGLLTIGTAFRIVLTIALIFLLSPEISIWLLYALMLAAGFYSAQQNVCSSTAPQLQIRQEIRFQSNSVVQTAQNLGSSVGMAVYTVVMAIFGISEGMTVALILASVAAVVSLIIVQFLQKLKSASES
jgi:MFS family permease